MSAKGSDEAAKGAEEAPPGTEGGGHAEAAVHGEASGRGRWSTKEVLSTCIRSTPHPAPGLHYP